MTIAGKIIHGLLVFFSLIKDEADEVITVANKFVNAFMAFEQTPLGQDIEKIIKSVIPASIQSAIQLALPVLFKDLKWATDNIENKTDEEVIQEGFEYLKNLSPSLKAVQLNSFAALIGEIVNGDNGAGLTIQQLLSMAQSAHDPSVMAVAA